MALRFKRAASYGLGLAALVLALEGRLLATVSVVPELDPGSLSGGLALLGAGILMLRARRRSK